MSLTADKYRCAAQGYPLPAPMPRISDLARKLHNTAMAEGGESYEAKIQKVALAARTHSKITIISQRKVASSFFEAR